MTEKYHIGEGNLPRPCEANVQECRLGLHEHGSLEVMMKVSETILEKEFAENLKSLQKLAPESRIEATVENEILRASKRMALKDMDTALMSSELRLRFPNGPMSNAIDMAAYAHRHQRRSLAGKLASTAYVDHPLRVALRLARYGVTDENVVLGAVLHDAVEDGREDLATMNGRALDSNVEVQHSAALKTVEEVFNSQVADIVNGVSNKPVKLEGTREEKNSAYLAKVTKSIESDPRAALVKFSDWVDNAVGLYHAFDNKVPLTPQQVNGINYRAVKYLPLANIFEKLLPDVEPYVSSGGLAAMRSHIAMASEKLPELVNRKK